MRKLIEMKFFILYDASIAYRPPRGLSLNVSVFKIFVVAIFLLFFAISSKGAHFIGKSAEVVQNVESPP